MNKERVEMMRVMLERVVHGSWRPTNDVVGLYTDMRTIKFESDEFKVGSCDLESWRDRSTQGCGFSACAVGHACFDAEFIKLGLKWGGMQPVYGGREHFEAVDAFFEFEQYKTSRILFLSSAYPPKFRCAFKNYPEAVREAKMVALRIEKLLSMTEHQFVEKYEAYYSQ